MQGPVTGEKAHVRQFWDAEPCGDKHAQAGQGTPEYFAEVDRARDRLEPFIARYADFAGTAGQRVLEIGVGLGTDFARFARAGADVTGVDLTERGVALTRRRLELEGLSGQVEVADAEDLPFPDASFDVVYSWGVIHHTSDPPRAAAEAVRVLKPGGRLCAMLYARRSWFAWGVWARHALVRGRPFRSVSSVLSAHLESPGTRAYTPQELSDMFGSLDRVRIDRVGTPYDRRVAGPLARATGARLGWFLVVRGVR